MGRQPCLALLKLLYFLECDLDILLLYKNLDALKIAGLFRILRMGMNRRDQQQQKKDGDCTAAKMHCPYLPKLQSSNS